MSGIILLVLLVLKCVFLLNIPNWVFIVGLAITVLCSIVRVITAGVKAVIEAKKENEYCF